MTHPLSRWSRHVGAVPPLSGPPLSGRLTADSATLRPLAADSRPRTVRTAAAAAAAGVLAAVLAPTALPASAAPQSCRGFGAAAAGDLVTLRLLDLRPVGQSLPTVVDLNLAQTRAGLVGTSGKSAAQAKYVQGTVVGPTAPTGPLGATAYQLAPPSVAEPAQAKPGRLDLGVARAGAGELNAAAKHRGGCDPDARADASAALLDTAVLPGPKALLKATDNLSTTAHSGLIRYRGRTGAEAATTTSLANLSLLGTVKVRVMSRPSLRAVAGGSKERSTVEYSAPALDVDVAGGHSTRLEHPGESVDVAVPAPGAAPVEGLPALSGNPLTDILGSVPGASGLAPDLGGILGGGRSGARAGAGASGGGDVGRDAGTGGSAGAAGASGRAEANQQANTNVSPSAGSAQPPAIPGLEALSGVPAVGGLLGGTGKVVVPEGRNAVVLRLTAGELSKNITNTGVHAKAISLRLKLLLHRGDSVITLVDLCVGVLEVAATAPTAGYHDGGGGYGPPGDNGGVAGVGPEQPQPSASLAGNAPKPPEASGKLPKTGVALSFFLAAGVLLVIAGRFLMVLARRRMVA